MNFSASNPLPFSKGAPKTTLILKVQSEDPVAQIAPAVLQLNSVDRSIVIAPLVPVLVEGGARGTAELAIPGYWSTRATVDVRGDQREVLRMSPSKLQKGRLDSDSNRSVRVKQVAWVPPHWADADSKGNSHDVPDNLGLGKSVISITGPEAPESNVWIPDWIEADSLRVEATAAGNGYGVWPSEPRLSLITQFLHGGDYQLASAAARSLELRTLVSEPTVRDPLRDLIVGYAHLLANERERMRAWYRRTGVALRGADAALLQSEVTRRGDESLPMPTSIRELGSDDIPCVSIGLEFAVRRELIHLRGIAGEDPESDEGQRYAKFQGALLRVTPESFFLSFPRDPEAALQWVEEPRSRTLARKFLQLIRGTKIWSRLWANGLVEIGRLGRSMTTTPEESSTKSTAKLSGPAVAVAVAAVIFWAASSLILLLNTSAAEPAWTRMAWVFGSIQAIAFAAAGALFGSTVAREQTQVAEKRADKAEAHAQANEGLATAGRALGASLQAEALVQEAEGDQPRGRPMGVGVVGPSADEAIARHARLSRVLFGDLV